MLQKAEHAASGAVAAVEGAVSSSVHSLARFLHLEKKNDEPPAKAADADAEAVAAKPESTLVKAEHTVAGVISGAAHMLHLGGSPGTVPSASANESSAAAEADGTDAGTQPPSTVEKTEN